MKGPINQKTQRVSASDWSGREPRRCKQARGDHDREDDWADEKVLPSKNCLGRKADGESPPDAMYYCQRLWLKTAKLPGERRGEYKKYRNEEPESDIEFPKSPARPLDLEVKRLQ